MALQQPTSRKHFLRSAASAVSASWVASCPPAHAAETVGKDPDCNDRSCLGVWDGLLADCPHGRILGGGGAGCTSSQDDTPGTSSTQFKNMGMNEILT